MARLLVLVLLAFAAAACGGKAAQKPGQSAAECPAAMTFGSEEQHENLDPAWSPDGTKIAFTTRNYDQIAVIDVRTCSVRRVIEGRRPTWSADGEQIAFERDPYSGESGLFIVGSDGTGARRIAMGESPDWSPVDDRIVFFSDGPRDLFVVRPDGTGLSRLTNVGAAGNPAWSADGKRIAAECGPDGALLCVVDSNGRELRRIDVKTDIPEVSWSPNGRTLTFAGNTGQGLGAWLLPLKSERPELLLPERLNAVDVDWSPRGDWIAVSIDSGYDSADLYLVHPDGTGLRRLTKSPPGGG